MEYSFKKETGFVSLIGMLIALCIVCYLCFIAFKIYFKNPSLEHAQEETRSERVIDTANYHSIVDSSRATIDNYNKQALQREKQLEEFEKGY